MGAIRLDELDSGEERRMDREAEGRDRERERGKLRETLIEMELGPRCMTAGIPAVHRTRRHLL